MTGWEGTRDVGEGRGGTDDQLNEQGWRGEGGERWAVGGGVCKRGGGYK